MQMETDSDKNDNCIGLEGVTKVEAGCCLKYLIIDMEAARCCLTLEECECHQKIGKTLKWNALMMHVCAREHAHVCVRVCRGGWEVWLCNGHFALFVFGIMIFFFLPPGRLWKSIQTSSVRVAVFLLSGRDLTTQELSSLIELYSYGDYFLWWWWDAPILVSNTVCVPSYSKKSVNAAPKTTLKQRDTALWAKKVTEEEFQPGRGILK